MVLVNHAFHIDPALGIATNARVPTLEKLRAVSVKLVPEEIRAPTTSDEKPIRSLYVSLLRGL